MNRVEEKMSFTCTDRFGETKSFELGLDAPSADKNAYNQELIEKLKDFQNSVNSLMTDFVNKEKDLLKEPEASRVKTSKSKTDDDDSEHYDDEDDQEGSVKDETEDDQQNVKQENMEESFNETESVKKRQNGDVINSDLDAKKKCLLDWKIFSQITYRKFRLQFKKVYILIKMKNKNL